MSVRRTAAAATIVCAAGLALAHAATDGFQAFTLESARRLHALRAPPPVPALTLELGEGRFSRLSDAPGRVLLVDFVYTRCATLCLALGSVYAQLRERLAPEIAAGEVRLVSISFDPRDGPGELAAWRARFGGSAGGWDVGRPARAAELAQALESFGVVVIPDGPGGFVHNAAVHVVGPDRKLVAILDPDDVDAVVKAARDALGSSRHAAAR